MSKHFLMFTSILFASQVIHIKGDIYILNPTGNEYKFYFTVKNPKLTKKSNCSSNFQLNVGRSESVIYHFTWPCSLDNLKKVVVLQGKGLEMEQVDLKIPKEVASGKHLFIVIYKSPIGRTNVALSDLIPLTENGKVIINLLKDTGKYFLIDINSQ